MALSFNVWEKRCAITGIIASGGIAPSPAPLGEGPGMVRGAKGNGGRLTGAYLDGAFIREKMEKYLADNAS
jgi:hypothetical protein